MHWTPDMKWKADDIKVVQDVSYPDRSLGLRIDGIPIVLTERQNVELKYTIAYFIAECLRPSEEEAA